MRKLKPNDLNSWTLILFVLALLPRIFNLNQFLTTDEYTNIFIAGSDVIKAFLQADFRQTYWHFYPGVTMSWGDAFGFVGQWLWLIVRGEGQAFSTVLDSNILEIIVALRLPYALLTALFVPAMYHLMLRWLDPEQTNPNAHYITLATTLLIAFDPFFLAHSRVNHGDASVTVFMCLSSVALFLYLRDGGRKMLFFSAVMGSLAALTKAPGQFMALFVIITALGDWVLTSYTNKAFDWSLAKRRMTDIIWWGSIAFATFFILWPSMWVQPFDTLRQMLDETFGKVDAGHLVFFMGQPTLDPGLSFYLYVIPFRLTPITSIGLLLSIATLIYQLTQKLRTKKSPVLTPAPPLPCTSAPLLASPPASLYNFALLLTFFAVSLLLFGNLSPKKQDRYLLPLFPMLDILAVIGWFGLWQFIKQYGPIKQKVTLFWLGGLVALQMGIAFLWYPYYLSYFNPLMGGLPRAVESTLVGWGEGMEQVAAYLNQKPNAESLYVASTPAQTLLPYFKGRGENFYTNDIALRANYVVIYQTQQQRLAPSPEIVREYMARQPEKIIEIMGVPYAWIYPNTPLIFSDVPSWATLSNIGFGEIMRLAGYQYELSNTSLDLDLFWHALAPLEEARGPCQEVQVEYITTMLCPRLDYAISVRLVAADGQIIAQNDSWPAAGLLPTSQWRVNDYVQDHHTLNLATPLETGRYKVMVVVYEAETQAVLAGPIEVMHFEQGE